MSTSKIEANQQPYNINNLEMTLTSVIVNIHSVPPPFQKGGREPKILKISKRGGGPEKKFWGGGNQKGGERFSKKRGGNPTF